MVGSLVEVGRARHPVSWIGDILKAADRTQCAPSRPRMGFIWSASTTDDPP